MATFFMSENLDLVLKKSISALGLIFNTKSKSFQRSVPAGNNQILVFKYEIWIENHLTQTKTVCTGFRITTGVPVESSV